MNTTLDTKRHAKNLKLLIEKLANPPKYQPYQKIVPNNLSKSNPISELMYALQISLDIETMLNTFLSHLAKSTKVQGLTFQYEPQSVFFKIGHCGSFTEKYDLSFGQEEYLGQIHFFQESIFSEKDQIIIEELLPILSLPLKNALAHHLALYSATHDSLTGAANRTTLMTTLSREIYLSKRYGNTFTILTFDIDQFKKINDQFGHTGGDEYLKGFTDQLQQAMRESDFLFRLGGDEFLVLLSKTKLDGALVLAKRMKACIQQYICQYGDESIQTTVSIGATEYQSNDLPIILLNRSDKALYLAKKNGKNMIQSL